MKVNIFLDNISKWRIYFTQFGYELYQMLKKSYETSVSVFSEGGIDLVWIRF